MDTVVISSGTQVTQSTDPNTVAKVTIAAGGTLALNRPLTVTGALSISGSLTCTRGGIALTFFDVTINSGGSWNMSGGNCLPTISGNLANSGGFTSGSGVHTLSGAGKTVSGTMSFVNLTVTGTVTNTGTLTVATQLRVNLSGALTNNGTVTVTGSLSTNAGTGTFTQGTNATLTLSDATTVTTLVATASDNTVTYNRVGSQAVKPTTYANLTLAGSGNKTTTGVTVDGILSMEGGVATAVPTYGPGATLQYKGSALQTTATEFPATFAGSGGVVVDNLSGVSLNASKTISGPLTLRSGALSIGATMLTLNGAITPIGGTLTGGATSNISVGGWGAAVLPAVTLGTLTINRASGITLGGNVMVNTTLTFTSGNITTGASVLILGASGTVVRTSGHVVGYFRKSVATGAALRTFEIGDANAYTPLTIAFDNVSVAGTLTASTTGSDHPSIATSGLNASKSVNRYWTLTNGGITFTSYTATFTFVPGDLDSGTLTGSLYVARHDGAVWSLPTTGARTPTTTQAAGMTSLSDFQLGEHALDHFRVEAAGGGTIAPQIAGVSFSIQVTAQDQFNNTLTSFTGTVNLTSTGTLSGGGGTTASFSGGVLSSHAVTISNTGSFTISATRTAGTETGTSNSFSVVATEAAISATSPGTLTEGTLNGATVTIDLTNATYVASLAVGDFSLATRPNGATISGVSRTSATRAVLTLAFDGTDFDTGQMLSVAVLQSALATGSSVTTPTVAVAADPAITAGLTGPGSVLPGAVSTAFTVETGEANGTSMAVATGQLFTLSSTSSGTPRFWSNANGTGAITSVTIATGQSIATFYYSDATAGNWTITASNAVLGSPTSQITVSTSSVTISSTSPGALTEGNLNGATVTIDLTNATFGGSLAVGDFSLATRPNGTTISGVSRTSATRAVLTLAFDGIDFDTDQMLSVAVLQSALATGSSVTTPTVAVAADPAITAGLTGPGSVLPGAVTTAIVLEAHEANGTSMTVATDQIFTLSSSTSGTGRFWSNANGTGAITSVTIAAGQSIATFYYADDTAGSWTITATNAVLGSPTSQITVSSSVAIISSTSPGALTEGNLNGATVTIDLTNATYAPSLVVGDFSLATRPNGATISGVARTSATRAVLTLAFDGSDFDIAHTLSVNVLPGALATGSEITDAAVAIAPDPATRAALTGPGSVLPNAVSTAVTLEAREANGTSMTVATDQVFTLSSTSGTGRFWSNANGTGAITSVTIGTGRSITTFYYTDDSAGSWTVAASNPFFGSATSQITVSSSVANISFTTPDALTEGNLNGATVPIRLINATFATSLGVDDFLLATAPSGTAIAGVIAEVKNETEVMLTLAFDGTDFDTDQTLSVTILRSALATGSEVTTATVAIAPNRATAAALTSPGSIVPNAVSTAITLEAREANGTSMTVATDQVFTLSSTSGTPQFWSHANGTGAITSVTIHAGQSIATFYYSDATPGSWTITAAHSALGSPTSEITVSVISAIIEQTNPTALTESTLNGATLTVALTNATYAAALGTSNFTLVARPTGTAISSVSRTSDTRAVLTLAFDGTDFNTDQTLSVAVLESAFATPCACTSITTAGVAVAADPPIVEPGTGPGPVRLTLGIVASNAAPVEGDTLTITVQVANASGNDAYALTIAVPVPSRMQFLSAAASLGSYDAPSGAWTIDTLAKNGEARLVITVAVKLPALVPPSGDAAVPPMPPQPLPGEPPSLPPEELLP